LNTVGIFLLFQVENFYRYLALTSVPSLIDDLHFSFIENLRNIRVIDFICPQLVFAWNFKIKNRVSGQYYPVPSNLKLSWMEALWLRKILQGAFVVRLFYQIDSKFVEINLESCPSNILSNKLTDLSISDKPVSVVGTLPENIYPRLPPDTNI
jgi:hypothetical protein